MAAIDTLKKAEAIKRVVARFVAKGGWQSECVKEACCWLDRSEKASRKAVVDYVAAEYATAGLNDRGQKE